ncbi:MAG: hypothetical protein CVT89_03635 [Candidatus Altiarchaeales archaeon HGW-Altiarchaeales-2]|nr:MAG: hypothetical protein CVT89_03635 [Candidatus Altiarchaeales archaeon HGW-Altiarchaeales-2]
MDEKDFEKLLQERENTDLDFKLDLPKSDKIARLVVAFYNSRGGKIVFGVENETREPVGLKDPQRTEERFTQSIRQYCRLDEEPEIEFVNYKNKEFVVVHCPKGKDTPYFVKGEHTPRVRIGSSDMSANREEIARLYREGSSESQDVYSVKNAGLEDIDMDKIKEYFRKSKLTKKLNNKHFYDLLKKENFIVEENNRLVPTLASILLFGKHPWINLPHTTILADRYQGVDMIQWVDKRELNGTIFELIDKTEKFFLENMKTAAWAKGFRTVHKTEYPIEALKEAVINALVHRDYYERENILIRMFDDRVEIISPGELLRPLTIKDLEKLNYKPKSRNKTLVDVLMRSELMDKRGTGILRIKSAMQGWGLSPPAFNEDSGYFVIKFTGPYQGTIIKIPEELNERQKKTIEYLKINGKITTNEYIQLSGVSPKTVKRDITDLKKKGIIEFKGSTRRGYYILKGMTL